MRNARLTSVVALAIVVCGCGYTLAGKLSLPADMVGIKTIGLVTFQNLSTTPDLDRIFTEALRSELISRAKFKIVSDATGADAVLTGSIRLDAPQPMAFTSGQAAKYSIMVIGTAEFKGIKENKVLWSTKPSLRVMEEYDLPAGGAGADLAALFIQDRNAIERLAKKFAETLVADMLSGAGSG